MSTGCRVVVFTPGLHAFGGVERLLVDLSRFLHGANLPHTILCLNRSIDLASQADWPMDVQALNPARNPLAESRALADYFKDPRNADIQTPLFFDLKSAFYAGLHRCGGFHLHLTDPPSLLPRDVSKYAFSLRGVLPGELVGRPGLPLALRGEAVHRINRRGVRRAASLIAMTNIIAGELQSLYGRRAIIVRPGVQPPASPARRDGQATLRFLSISRMEPSKRIDWMLQALARLEFSNEPLSRQCDWMLDVVGDGSAASALRQQAASLGISDRVVFHGRLPDEKMEDVFARASVFLMPAVQGYGLPALESLMRGVPVILHRQSGVSEILDCPPWVETITDGADNLAASIRRMVYNISSGALLKVSRPPVPSAAQWASDIVKVCGWS